MEMEIEPSSSPSFQPEVPVRKRRLFGRWNELLYVFSPSERLFLYVLSVVLAVSTFVLLASVNERISTEVPTQGGSLVEGGAGTPRFINPLLAASAPDQDLTELVYSGLLRSENVGEYAPDLAASYDVSEDGTVYTFHLRDGLTFHDGEPLTSADVMYTISLAQNPEIKSPRRADWDGVAVAAPDERTIVFTLPHAYAPFRENATLGILPRHLWEHISDEEFPFASLNTHPIGSGPYRVTDVRTDSTGAPTEYSLVSFNDFALGEPHLSRLTYRAYQNEELLLAAYENGDIESFVASSPKVLPRDIQDAALIRAPLARVFGVFLNQNHAPVLTNAAAREALNAAINKDEIVAQVLGGYGTVLESPLPPGLLTAASTTKEAPTDRIENAKTILRNGGWQLSNASSSEPVWTRNKQSLTMSLATTDTEELVATANAVATAWRAVGIPTKVEVYPLQEFNATILRPRAYDAVLFGEVVGRSLDLFAFWHSSQRNDPGLNLSLYTSTDADHELAAARAETDLSKRQEHLTNFLKTLDEDRPAVFLYTPEVAYIVPSYLKGVTTGTLSSPSDRFISVHTWYRDTERVWNFFTRPNTLFSSLTR
jgi:peptide/nickel transport system substrate-binding protein